ncbi:M48 family metallopeptidase [Helicobacter sp. 13S00477-4]|uniref:M48 family metallopeptidase n=1 Tax=Helicobacter sp. 13S00477-4 TaxID=1905759 RepID=UPI000BA4F747|nr:M48 family metallopeptidase [Helicobacter sp. 13S00477-4]PAF51612.1 peptidase M48 [Helicobacter sp. 13S00477-4]
MFYLLAFSFIIFYTMPSIILALLQIQHVAKKMKQDPVILSSNDYIEAGKYSLAKLKLSVVQNLIEMILFLIWISNGLSLLENIFSRWEFPQNIHFLFFVLGFLLISLVISLPMNFYETMILDKKFGFSKITFGLFVKDFFKSLIMVIVIGGILVFLLIYIMENFQYWWLQGFFLVFIFAILVNVLYPILIAPIFNKFTPLDNDSLREKIEAMMQKVGFRSNGIFVMDASKRDGRLNAYFGGLGKSKRVVLFDTLLEKVSQDGLLSILGHELGHFKHKDIIKNLFTMSILLFIIFFLAGNLPQSFFEIMNISLNPGSTIVFLILIVPVISFWAMPILGYFSRRAEFRADEYGAMLTSKRCLAEALIRIVNENKAFPCSHSAYIFFYYTHPPLLKRLEALDYHMEK